MRQILMIGAVFALATPALAQQKASFMRPQLNDLDALHHHHLQREK